MRPVRPVSAGDRSCGKYSHKWGEVARRNRPLSASGRGRQPPPRIARGAPGGLEARARLGHGSAHADAPVPGRRRRLDLRYATADNLLGRPVYDARRRAAPPRGPGGAAARGAARRRARPAPEGLRCLQAPRGAVGLLGCRADKTFVADPRTGGTHPRGIAVDLTLVDAATGAELPMGTGFDDFSPLSAHDRLEGLAPSRPQPGAAARPDDGLRLRVTTGRNGGTTTCPGAKASRRCRPPTCPEAHGRRAPSRPGRLALAAALIALGLAAARRPARPGDARRPRRGGPPAARVPRRDLHRHDVVNCPQPVGDGAPATVRVTGVVRMPWS